MKFSKLIGKNPLEIVLAVLLVIFILSPIQPPSSIAGAVDSTLGIITVSILIVYLFVYSHSLLAILFVVAIFELVRRSSARKQIQPAVVTYTALQPETPQPIQPAVASAMSQVNTMNQEPRKNLAQSERENMRRNQDVDVLRAGGIGMAPGMGGMVGYPSQQLGANIQPPIATGTEFMDYEMSQAVRDREMMEMNTKLMEVSLEEEVVHTMPVPSIDQDALDHSFKPVYNNIHQASTF
jgi:hypothetical protein